MFLLSDISKKVIHEVMIHSGHTTHCSRSQISDLYICYSAPPLVLLRSVSSLAQGSGFSFCARRAPHRSSVLLPLVVCGGCIAGFSFCAWRAPVRFLSCFAWCRAHCRFAVRCRSIQSLCMDSLGFVFVFCFASSAVSLRCALWCQSLCMDSPGFVLFCVLLGVKRSVALPCAADGFSLGSWIATAVFVFCALLGVECSVASPCAAVVCMLLPLVGVVGRTLACGRVWLCGVLFFLIFVFVFCFCTLLAKRCYL